MAFERMIAVVAGLALAATAPWVIGSQHGAVLALLAVPPIGTGLAAAGIAAARTARVRAGWIVTVELLVLATAAIWGVLGLLLVLPAFVAWAVGATFLAFTREGSGDGRPARTVIATGALWTIVFAIVAWLGGGAAAQAALGASLALALGGLAWSRAIERDAAGLPAAIARGPGACSSDPA